MARADTLVVVVDGDREDLLGAILKITYWSSAEMIWRGLGSFVCRGFARGASSISSSMISWQRLMHSSQM